MTGENPTVDPDSGGHKGDGGRGDETERHDMEDRMRAVSLILSLSGLSLMCAGLVEMVAKGNAYLLPGQAVLPLDSLVNLRSESIGMLAVSAGVAVLGFLPAVRVLIALGIYLRRNEWLSMLVALVVLIELVASALLGHHQ